MKFKNKFLLFLSVLIPVISFVLAMWFGIFAVVYLLSFVEGKYLSALISFLITLLSAIVGYKTFYFLRAVGTFTRTKDAIDEEKYLVFSFDTFKSTYNLMETRCSETGQKNPFDLDGYRILSRSGIPYYNDTVVVFDNALDYIKYTKFLSNVVKNKRNKKVVDNLDTEAFANLKKELHKEKERHEQESNEAIEKMKKIALTLGSEPKEESAPITQHWEVDYMRNFGSLRDVALVAIFSKEKEAKKFVKYLTKSSYHSFMGKYDLSDSKKYSKVILSADDIISSENKEIESSFRGENYKSKKEYKPCYRIWYTRPNDERKPEKFSRVFDDFEAASLFADSITKLNYHQFLYVETQTNASVGYCYHTCKEAYEDEILYLKMLKNRPEPNVYKVYYKRLMWDGAEPIRLNKKHTATFLNKDYSAKATAYLQGSQAHVYLGHEEVYDPEAENYTVKDFQEKYSWFTWFEKESDWEENNKREVQKSKEEEYNISFPLKVYITYTKNFGEPATRDSFAKVVSEYQEYSEKDAIRLFFKNLDPKTMNLVVYKANWDGTFGDNITEYFISVWEEWKEPKSKNEAALSLMSATRDKITTSTVKATGGKGNQYITDFTLYNIETSEPYMKVDFGEPVTLSE